MFAKWGTLCLAVAALAQEPAVKFGTTVVIPYGLEGVIYYLKPDTARLPNLKKLKPRGTIYTTELNVPPQDFRSGFPGVTKRYVWFAIEYTGRFWISNPGKYSFVLTSDDGSKLFIDGHLVIDNDGIHPPQDRDGSVNLKPGVHDMRVQYYQGPPVNVALVLRVSGPGRGQPLVVFSTNEFKPPPEAWTDLEKESKEKK